MSGFIARVGVEGFFLTLYAHEMAAGVASFFLTLYVGVEGFFLIYTPMKWPPGWKAFS